MRVLILGGTGFVGRRLVPPLRAAGWEVVVAARRRPPTAGAQNSAGAPDAGLRWHALNSCDRPALTDTLRGVDAVINAVAGRPRDIAAGARALAEALRAVGGRPLVHLSSMAVYGEVQGPVPAHSRFDGSEPFGPLPAPLAGRPYVVAKREAERHLAPLGAAAVPVTLLRPGCVWGPGSLGWVDRLARLLHAGRLGDLGADGDGWTHGVHVDDVCQAVLRALAAPQGGTRVYPLAAPDSPRWNTYLQDLARAVQAPPLARPPAWQLQLDAWVASPLLHLAQLAGGRWLGHGRWQLPPPLPPSLLALMRRGLEMDARAAARELGLVWTPYPRALRESAEDWSRRQASRSARATNSGLPST